MNRLTDFIVEKRRWIFAVFVLLLIGSGVAALNVVTNYDMLRYMDQDSPSVIGVKKTTEEYGIPTTMRVMVEDIEIADAVKIKEKIKNAAYVQSITWLDDAVDIFLPPETMDQRLLESFYKDRAAIFTVYLDYSDYSAETGAAIDEIQEIIGEKGYIFGPASSSQQVVKSTEASIGRLIPIFIPVIFIILIFATSSWLEPLIFMITLGFAVALNTGSNLLMGEVSFITVSMSAAIQLAISMDYSIFLLHRFAEEKRNGLAPKEAMKVAIKRSFATITASGVTTIAGFISLLLMKFKIGTDMGLVFGKGIIFSWLCAIFLLPAVTLMLTNLIDKTTHRNFIPSFKGLGKVIYKLRYISILVLVVLVVPAFMGQQSSDFIYGGSGIAEEEGTPTYTAKTKIENRFGTFNPVIVLVKKGNIAAETLLAKDLQDYKYIGSVQSAVTIADPNLPQELLPKMVTKQFVSTETSRLIIGLNTPEESTETFEAVEWIKNKTAEYYNEGSYWVSGLSVSLYDVMRLSDRDNLVVSLMAIICVGLVIGITFKNIIAPLILVFVIEAAVFINMSVPYFLDQPIIFVGMLIVSSLMLGATIDYAILMTSRYKERREKMNSTDSLINAVADSSGSIMTSGLVLTVSGYTIKATSEVATVSEMGELIGRGAIFSVLVVIIVLPALLYTFDRFIIRGGRNAKQSN